MSFLFMKEFRILRSFLYSSWLLVMSDKITPMALRRYPKAMQDKIIQNDVKSNSSTVLGTVPIFFIVVNAQYCA